jgi:hypothetical protein
MPALLYWGLGCDNCSNATRKRVDVRIVDSISVDELRAMASKMFDPLVKGVVDVRRRTLVLDAGLHSDEELHLLESGSRQEDLWGINLWPDDYGTNGFIEFDSMINIRPLQGNRSRGVDDPEIRKQVADIVGAIVHE